MNYAQFLWNLITNNVAIWYYWKMTTFITFDGRHATLKVKCFAIYCEKQRYGSDTNNKYNRYGTIRLASL